MKKVLIGILIFLVFLGSVGVGIYLSSKYVSGNNTENIFQAIENGIREDIKNKKEEKEPVTVVIEPKEDIKVRMSVIGDIMCHNSQYNDAYRNGEYDFSYVFEDIKPYIENADIAIGNLETTFAGAERGYSSYPTFNTPENLAIDLKELGIDVLATANNHSLDKGYKGIESTINFLDEVGIAHTGTFTSKESQNEILIQEVNGLKIAFLSYTYGTNGIPVPSGKEYSINLIDKDLIKNHLEIARNLNPDVICVNMHWGIEYQNKPNEEQIDLADFLFENGADIILGSHPHVIQKMESKVIQLEDGTEKNGFVIYSLGNFVSGQDKANTRNSIILGFDIVKSGKDGKISIENVEYVPIYTYTSPKYKNYKVIDIRKTIAEYEEGTDISIGANNYKILMNELEHVNSIFGE